MASSASMIMRGATTAVTATATSRPSLLRQRTSTRRCVGSMARELEQTTQHKQTQKQERLSMKATEGDTSSSPSMLQMAGAMPLLTALLTPPAASAAVSPVAAAGAAYGHYFCLLLMTASLAVERVTVNPKPTKEDLQTLLIADSLYGIGGLGMLYTGYLRVTKYAKGWEYYQHEPLFWFKMFLFGVVGSSSLFVTTKIIQTQIAMTENGGVPPEIGEKLTTRMQKIINAELLAFFSIPFVASLMARGVAYDDGFDWHIGAGLVALGSIPLSIKYVTEALNFPMESEEAK